MLLATLVLAVALPSIVPDPRHGPSDWMLVAGGEAPGSRAAGYLIPLPDSGVDQSWLEQVVALSAGGVPVVAMSTAPPPPAIRPYLDGVLIEPAPTAERLAAVLEELGGLPLLLAATDTASAVSVLSAGATSALVPRPHPEWPEALEGLLPDYEPAMGPAGPLPTALRGSDLATVVGIPRGFEGGAVRLAGGWYGEARLAGGPVLRSAVAEGKVVLTVPALPDGGVVVAIRPLDPTETLAQVEVRGEHIPVAEEILARHQRQAARQERQVTRWLADQTLLVRVEIAELARSFSVVLAGPAFWEAGVGRDWEISRSWVDGVAWRPDRLPELPLLEPSRPPVPPLALRLETTYRYVLNGASQRRGRRCWELGFDWQQDRERRTGTACIDAQSFGLVSLEEVATGLAGEVRSTRSITTFEPLPLGEDSVWLPVRVEADDTVAAFGGTALVRRELTLRDLTLNPPEFGTARTAAWAGPNRMLRDTVTGTVPLLPDGRGGRRIGGETRPAQRFLIAGAAWDPGLEIPVPFGGLQVLDFDFRGRGEQLRMLLAGVVNDAAWSIRRHGSELNLRAFVQLLPFSSTTSTRGEKIEEQTVELRRQRVSVGVGTTLGRMRLRADAGAEYWDFGRSDDTAEDFVLPRDTWEWVARLEGEVPLGPATLSLMGERGWRQSWETWGPAGSEQAQRQWTRARAFFLYEKAIHPLARLRLESEYWAGWHLDRFSAPSPARFGGVRLRGIASGTVQPERLGVVRASVAVPLGPRLRGEVGIDAGWVREKRSGYRHRPLSGCGVAATVPGPWGTLIQASVGVPLATPGKRAPSFELFILRPL
jgi:hypothetical protein